MQDFGLQKITKHTPWEGDRYPRRNDKASWPADSNRLFEPSLYPRMSTPLLRGQVYVNMINLLDCWNVEKEPGLFRSKAKLAQYTWTTGKYFSLPAVKLRHCEVLIFPVAQQDKVLRVLLSDMVRGCPAGSTTEANILEASGISASTVTTYFLYWFQLLALVKNIFSIQLKLV